MRYMYIIPPLQSFSTEEWLEEQLKEQYKK